jgi:hypothetical protein
MTITNSSYNFTTEQIRNMLKDQVIINITEENNPDLFYWLCLMNQIFISADSKKQVLEQWMCISNVSINQQNRFYKEYSNVTGNMRHYISWSLSYSNKVDYIRNYYLTYEHYRNDGKRDKPMITLEDKYTKKNYYPFWAHISDFGHRVGSYRCSNIIEFIIMLCYIEYDWDYNYTKDCLERAIDLIESGSKYIKDECINNYSVDEWCYHAYNKLIIDNSPHPLWKRNWLSTSRTIEYVSDLKCEKNKKDKDREHHYFDIEVKTKDEDSKHNEMFNYKSVDRTKIKFITTDNTISVSID